MDWERFDRFAGRAQIPLTIGGYAGGAYTLWPKGAVLFGSIRDVNWMAVAAIAFLGLGVLSTISQLGLLRLSKPKTIQPTLDANTSQATSTTTFRNVDDFYRTYDNILLIECETAINKASSEYPPEQRERFVVRLLATVTIISLFERTWLNIYGSQLQLLNRLATCPSLTLAEARSCYDDSLQHYPEPYKTKASFELWLAFLRTWVLILEQGDTIQIIIRGKEFLKYLVQMGYDPKLRSW